MKLRSHIALLVATILVPTLLFSAGVLHLLLTAERQAALRSMQELARASVSVMDRELTFAMATAQALSTSPSLRDGDFAAFYAEARASSRGRPIQSALLDEHGQQIFNTARPYGTRIPAPNAAARERIRRVLASGGTVYSDLIKGSATGKYVVSAEVPATLRDGRRVVVNEWMYAGYLNGLLPAKNIPSSWLIAVFDKQGITIARNINPEKFVGSPPREERLRTILAGFEGVSRAYTRDGVEMYGAWERSSLTGWSVGVGVPVAEIESTAVRSVALTAGGFILTVLLGVGGALVISRRLVGAIDEASAAAESLPRYQIPPVVDLRVEEMNRLQMALHRAGTLLVAGEALKQKSLEDARGARMHAEAAQKVAEEQNRAKDEFLAMLGHELRNPLAAIASGVTLLGIPGTQGERQVQVRAIIQRQTQHLTRLVDELLDAHRILNGKITLAKVPVDLKAAVEACLASFETRGALARHRLTVELAPATIEGDPTRLEQMVCNLVDNALKYTPEGGSIDVKLHSDHGHAVLSVADSGIGLSPDLLDKVFDVFVQGKVVNRTRGGLGIGLAVVNSLARQHGATLAAESAGINQGSRFTLRFPLSTTLPVQAARQAAPGSTGGARVLVVEDNRDIREMMFLMLSEQGYTVHAVHDGQSGIAAASTFHPCIAFVDIDLPDISGHEIAKTLRARPDTAGIALVAVTGYGQAMDREQAYAAGFDAHLTKPVPIEALIKAIEETTRQPTAQA